MFVPHYFKMECKIIWFILLKYHIKRYVYTTKLRKLIVKLQRQLVSKIYNYKTKPKVQQKCVKINYSHFNVNLTKRVCIMLIKTLYLILDWSLPYFRISFIFDLISILFLGKQASQYSFHNIHLAHRWVLQIASHPNILKPVKDILGSNLMLLDSRFICKYPESDNGVQAFVAWHQDMK